MFGEVSPGENKKLGRTIFYDNMSRGRTVKYFSSKGSSYEVEVFGLKNIERESRPSPIKITHKFTQVPKHEIKIVVDLKHIYQDQNGVHLNLTEDSKAVIDSCPDCKYCFGKLNHAEINPIKHNYKDMNHHNQKIEEFWGKVKKGQYSKELHFEHIDETKRKDNLINTTKTSEGESIDSDFIFGQISQIIKVRVEALGYKNL